MRNPYRLAPRTVEFWQARAKRLHDQLLYTRNPDGSWQIWFPPFQRGARGDFPCYVRYLLTCGKLAAIVERDRGDLR